MNTRTFHVVSGDRDERLVEALRHGESSAAESLVATYQDRAYRLAIRIAAKTEDAEEIVQDAFLTVIQRSTRSGASRPLDPGSTESSPTARTASSATARADAGRSPWTTCSRYSTRTGGMQRRWPTGLRLWTTRRGELSCASG
jgi:Sigma-70 region 2